MLFVYNWFAAENLDRRDDYDPTLCGALFLLFAYNWFAHETLNHNYDYDAINSGSSQTFRDCDHMVVKFTSRSQECLRSYTLCSFVFVVGIELVCR